jgi:hypothetical protein
VALENSPKISADLGQWMLPATKYLTCLKTEIFCLYGHASLLNVKFRLFVHDNCSIETCSLWLLSVLCAAWQTFSNLW